MIGQWSRVSAKSFRGAWRLFSICRSVLGLR
jgi:hypothetical protein